MQSLWVQAVIPLSTIPCLSPRQGCARRHRTAAGRLLGARLERRNDDKWSTPAGRYRPNLAIRGAEEIARNLPFRGAAMGPLRKATCSKTDQCHPMIVQFVKFGALEKIAFASGV